MEEKQAITSENKPKRDKKGRLLPGNTANPNGRPEGSLSLVAILKKLLEDVPEGEKETNAIILMKEAIRKARGKNALFGGDASMLKDIMNRVDGMPKQSLEHTGANDGPIQINIVDFKNVGESEKVLSPDELAAEKLKSGFKADEK